MVPLTVELLKPAPGYEEPESVLVLHAEEFLRAQAGATELAETLGEDGLLGPGLPLARREEVDVAFAA